MIIWVDAQLLRIEITCGMLPPARYLAIIRLSAHDARYHR
jgi:hypothetical protein